MHLFHPKNPLQELSGMSSYQELILEELFDACKSAKNRKITIFQDEFLSGSSDFKDEIWSEMESLGVLDVFYTYSQCATTSGSNFKEDRILVIFGILICGFS